MAALEVLVETSGAVIKTEWTLPRVDVSVSCSQRLLMPHFIEEN